MSLGLSEMILETKNDKNKIFSKFISYITPSKKELYIFCYVFKQMQSNYWFDIVTTMSNETKVKEEKKDEK